MVKTSYTEVNFCQVCRECKSYYRNFKLNINKCYNENGESYINTKELYEKFSFICPICNLLNILNFSQICKKETVFMLRRRQNENEKANI